MEIFERLHSWWWGLRVPEGEEAMDSGEEVEAYADAAAQRHLARLDADAARRAAPLFQGCRWVIDLGCGPAAIPLLLTAMVPGVKFVGVDLSMPMLRHAHGEMRRRALGERLSLVCADASALPFRGASFDGTFSNSLVHHLTRPRQVLDELSRVSSSRAAWFLRDLRRPPRILQRLHLAMFGRCYHGAMRRLFDASVRAAYTTRELRELLRPFPSICVSRRGGAHIEAIRRAAEGLRTDERLRRA